MARAVVKSHSSSSIGSVKQSMLDEATFQSIHGTGWVLMDGRGVTAAELGEDSDYFLLTGFANIPDARGQFLRGKDHGRHLIDGEGNPDGDLALGTLQQDKTRLPRNSNFTTDDPGSHSHNYDRLPTTGGGGVQFNPGETGNPVSSPTTNAGAHTHSIVGGGDNETTPKNTTVNIFIKINE